MKKIFSFVIILLLMICNFNQSLAVDTTYWDSPTRLKTYIPNNKRTLMMKHAFARWSKATGNKIVFQYVPTANTAQIKVNFVDTIPNADREVGLTKSWYYQNGEMAKADIYIAEQTTDGRQLGNDAVFTVMIHEIGHAIGIVKHSNDPLSIMFPIENDVQEITSSDVQKLKQIYGWK